MTTEINPYVPRAKDPDIVREAQAIFGKFKIAGFCFAVLLVFIAILVDSAT